VFADQRLRIVERATECRQRALIAHVPERDAHVAQQARAFRAQNGRAGEPRFERGIVEDTIIGAESCRQIMGTG